MASNFFKKFIITAKPPHEFSSCGGSWNNLFTVFALLGVLLLVCIAGSVLSCVLGGILSCILRTVLTRCLVAALTFLGIIIGIVIHFFHLTLRLLFAYTGVIFLKERIYKTKIFKKICANSS